MPSITTSDSVRLDFTEGGDPAGRPVVLIAGFKAAATSWLYQQKVLAQAGFRVLSFDRRGHGRSETPTFGATMQRHGQDLHEFLEQLDLHDAVLVGGSQGGNTIWSTVSQHGTDRVAGIVIVDQTPSMLNRADWPHGFYDYTEENAHTLFATTIPDPGRHPVKDKGIIRIARIIRAMARPGTRREKGFTEAELALLGDHARADWRPAIAATRVPVLFVAGRESEFWPAEHAVAAAALAADGRAVVIEDAGHATNIEQPKAFNEALLAFIRSL